MNVNEGAIVPREQDVLRWGLERGIWAPDLDAQDFYRVPHRLIWAAKDRLTAQGRSGDYLTIKAELDRRGELDAVNPIYLHELARDSVRPSDLAVISAADEIRTAARTRRVRAMFSRYALAEDIDLDRVASELDALRATQRDGPYLLDDAAVLNLPGVEHITAGIPARSLIALIGDSGIGKTFIAIDFGLSVAARRPWLNQPIERPGPAIYIAAEGAPAPRIGGWKIAHDFSLEAPIGLHTWSGAVNLLNPVAVSAFIAAAKPIKPVVVIIDTLARCLLGGDENSAKDMGLAVASMDRIRTQLDATVIVLHHTNKAGTSERGSGALRGACDTVLHLQHADDLLQLTCSKQKDAEPFEPISLKLVPYEGTKTCIVRLASDVVADEALTDAQGKALHALTELFGDMGAKTTEWMEAIPSMARATFYRARNVLADRGYIQETGGKFYPTGKRPVSRRLTASLTESEYQSQAVA